MRRLRDLAKRCLPPAVRTAARAAEDAAEHRLYRPANLGLCLRDALDLPPARLPERQEACAGLLDWLARAQDVWQDGGVAGWYALGAGWSPGYPETTGYIILTLLESAESLRRPSDLLRARRAAEWEVRVQLPDGSWQAGFVSGPPRPAVFNTGQVIQGLLAAHRTFGDAAFAAAAERGAAWLLAVQDADGAWRRNEYHEVPHVYATRVAWPLAQLAEQSGDRRVREAARRNLDWALTHQGADGWFAHCGFAPGEPPLTHTLAYTLEGLVEAAVVLREERYLEAGRRGADALLLHFERRRRLAGTYGPGWSGDHRFTCLTGCAQMGRVWGRLFELTGDARYLNATAKINDQVLRAVPWSSRNPGLRGGVPGSQPVWGDYMRFRIPNWAAKFALDSLLQEARALRLLARPAAAPAAPAAALAERA
ncbi:MAG: hypothetical protein ACE147_14420 [Candidatus Methylomirabilales bacterium]